MKDKLAKLIDVKSIMTLALTGGFIALTCAGEITGEQFLTIFTMIVGFYFGTQSEKSKQKQKEVVRYLPAVRVITAELINCKKKERYILWQN